MGKDWQNRKSARSFYGQHLEQCENAFKASFQDSIEAVFSANAAAGKLNSGATIKTAFRTAGERVVAFLETRLSEVQQFEREFSPLSASDYEGILQSADRMADFAKTSTQGLLSRIKPGTGALTAGQQYFDKENRFTEIKFRILANKEQVVSKGSIWKRFTNDLPNRIINFFWFVLGIIAVPLMKRLVELILSISQ